jgi:hypothetical protein
LKRDQQVVCTYLFLFSKLKYITDILLKVAFNTINHQTTETCITVRECFNIPKVAKEIYSYSTCNKCGKSEFTYGENPSLIFNHVLYLYGTRQVADGKMNIFIILKTHIFRIGLDLWCLI